MAIYLGSSLYTYNNDFTFCVGSIIYIQKEKRKKYWRARILIVNEITIVIIRPLVIVN